MDYNFDHIVNWKLLQGSHEMPGPDGGTCINEAAIVAAGLPYRKIGSACDLPQCFSRPIGAYAMNLNDGMGDGQRQKLIPFVTRLAGTADTPAIELQRGEWIITSLMGMMAQYLPYYVEIHRAENYLPTVGGIYPLYLSAFTYQRVPMAIHSMAHVREYLNSVFGSLTGAMQCYADVLIKALYRLASDSNGFSRKYCEYTLLDAISRAFKIVHMWCYGSFANTHDGITDAFIAILDGALKIGRRTPDLDQELIVQRMEKAKQLVLA